MATDRAPLRLPPTSTPAPEPLWTRAVGVGVRLRPFALVLLAVGAPLGLAAVLLFAALTLHSQSPEGEIRVQVKDPSGAAMQASGKLQSIAPGVQRSFQTDAQGRYTLAGLPFGRYRLEISKDGFATQSALIDVASATPISRTVTMPLGTQASKVDVVATTPLAGTDLSLLFNEANITFSYIDCAALHLQAILRSLLDDNLQTAD